MNCSLVSGADTFEIRTPPKPFLCKGILGHFPSEICNLRSPEMGFPTHRGQGSVSQSFIFFINLEDSTAPTCFYIGVSNPLFVSSHKNFFPYLCHCLNSAFCVKKEAHQAYS